MDTSVNKASWRYKMNLERPQCCNNNGAFASGSSNFWGFNRYIAKHNIDRNKMGGLFHPLSSHTLPYWIIETRNRKI